MVRYIHVLDCRPPCYNTSVAGLASTIRHPRYRRSGHEGDPMQQHYSRSGMLQLSSSPSVLRRRPKPIKLASQDAKTWTDYTIPMPKTIEITGKVRVAGERGDCATREHDQITLQVAKELREAFGTDENARPPCQAGVHAQARDRRAGLGGAEVARRTPTRPAGYIAPADAPNELRIVALAPRGLYYAAKTLQQLVLAKADGDFVEMPILNMTDWPDMEDRGLWGADPYRYGYLRWLGDLKMNELEQICGCRNGRQRQAHSRRWRAGRSLCCMRGRDTASSSRRSYSIWSRASRVCSRRILSTRPWTRTRIRSATRSQGSLTSSPTGWSSWRACPT